MGAQMLGSPSDKKPAFPPLYELHILFLYSSEGLHLLVPVSLSTISHLYRHVPSSGLGAGRQV